MRRLLESATRSAVTSSLAYAMLETLQWLQSTDTDHEELASLALVVAEAQAHQSRMRTVRAAAGQGRVW
ncbi:MAG: hypothetical protein H0T91_01825 [Propionibacteriaceae bacterium]|nr:hypothetical protein [Propionibacteriaceae bacterium]